MRILIFNEFYYPNQTGGAEISTQLLAEQLVRLENEVYVCTLSDIEYRKEINGVKVIYINNENLYWEYQSCPNFLQKVIWHFLDSNNFRIISKIKKLITEIDPDIVHTNNLCGFSTIIWKIVSSLKIPIVHTVRDYYLMCSKTTMFSRGVTCKKSCFDCRFFTRKNKCRSKNVNAVVGISNYILNKHIKNGFFQGVATQKVIYNPVEVKLSDHKIDRNYHIIGFMGTIAPYKGIERLIHDFCSLKKPNYKLEIAGNGEPEYIKYLKDKFQAKNIQFLGRVKPEFFLSSIGLLVVPSIWEEPFGRVVVEASAYKCPVFVSEKGGLSEVLNTKVGKSFDIENPESLKNLLACYMEHRLIFDFQKDRLTPFTNTTIANQYLTIYKQL